MIYRIEKVDFDALYNALKSQTRQRKSRSELSKLIESIKENGLLHPPVVTQTGEKGFHIVAGAGRIEALNYLKQDQDFMLSSGSAYFPSISVSVSDHALSDDELTIAEFEENAAREDLTPADSLLATKAVVEAYKRLHGVKTSTAKDAPGISNAGIAKRLKKSEASLSRDLQLADFVEATGDLTTKSLSVSEIAAALETVKRKGALALASKKHERSIASLSVTDVRRIKADAFQIGNALELVGSIKPESYDFVEMDSPYGIDLLNLTGTDTSAASHYKEWTPEEYRTNLPLMMQQAYRVLRNDRYAIFWFAINRWYKEAVEEAEAAGFSVDRIPGIWIRPVGFNNAPTIRLTNVAETFLVLHKGDARLAKAGVNNVFAEKPVASKKKIHRTEKPVELYENLFKTFLYPASDILVMFAGSGNALIAGLNHRCNVLGFDLVKENKDAYIDRVMTDGDK